MRDHVMRRLQEPAQGRRGSRFPAIELGDEGQGARRCHPYFTSSHLQPFYRAEFGFKRVRVQGRRLPRHRVPRVCPVCRARRAHQHRHPLPQPLQSPDRRGDRVRHRCPRACAGGGAVRTTRTGFSKTEDESCLACLPRAVCAPGKQAPTRSSRMPDRPARAEARGGPSRRGQWWARELYVQSWGGLEDPKTIVSL